jgi:hypothetical protein
MLPKFLENGSGLTIPEDDLNAPENTDAHVVGEVGTMARNRPATHMSETRDGHQSLETDISLCF